MCLGESTLFVITHITLPIAVSIFLVSIGVVRTIVESAEQAIVVKVLAGITDTITV